MKKIIVLLIIFLSSCSSEKEVAVDNTPKLLPTVETIEVATIGVSSAEIVCKVVSDGGKPITTYGVCWSLTGNPDINSNHVDFSNQGAAVSAYNCSLTSLQDYTTYNVRAYATNTDGTSYGNMLTFKTLSSIPLNFTTKEITDVAATSASTYLADLSEIGNQSFLTGICYGVTNNPTVSNNLLTKHIEDRYVFKNLLPNTTYYVRAYYTNTITNVTGYGQTRVFTTLASGTSPQGENAICDGIQITTVVPVTSITGRVWMDRNLGASRTPTIDDWRGARGGLYQWGRGNDGHASILAEYTNTISSNDIPGNNLVISGVCVFNPNSVVSPCFSYSHDWRVPKNDNLWQGVNGINNPCPLGYRLPSTEEFQIEFAAYNITNRYNAIISPLKFLFDGNSFYWTSSARLLPEGYGSYGFFQYGGSNDAGIFLYVIDRSAVGCIRCIKD